MDTAHISNTLKSPAISLIVAKRGFGKTTLLKNFLKQLPAWSLYDINHEYNAQEFNAVIVYYFNDLKFLLQRNEPRIIFKPKTSKIETFEFWCAIHYELARDYILILEEINKFLPSTMGSVYGKKLIDMGRHKNLGMIGTCRRIIGLDKDYTAQCDNFFMGRTFLPNDLKYIAEFLPEEILKKITKLPKFSFIYWNDLKEKAEEITSKHAISI